MNIQPSIDLKKVNLQTAVGYLVSLHDNMYQWNLLGIKVVGVAATEADIPTGEYEYGDAYEVGTEPPYDLYIYTRPDGVVHTEGYWFNTGKFPLPGPQGPKGEGFEDVSNSGIGGSKTQIVRYDTQDGMWFSTSATVQYKDRDDGKIKTATFPIVLRLPFLPGKYLSMDATAGDEKLEIKVDETELALDYYKIKKGSTANVPAYSPTSGVIALPYSYQNSASSLVRRGLEGEAKFTYGIFGRWNDLTSGNVMYFSDIYAQIGNNQGVYLVSPTLTDTGTFNAVELEYLQTRPQYQIQYRKQIYYRMDPLNAPNGTRNYIHIDSIQDGNGGYKATGKCFSVTVSTGAWQLLDINFASPVTYNHYITMTDNVSGSVIQMVIASKKAEAMTIDEVCRYVNSIPGGKHPCNTIVRTQAGQSANWQPAMFDIPNNWGNIISIDISDVSEGGKSYTYDQLTFVDYPFAIA